MIPFLLAAVGGYFIGDSMKGQTFADGGKVRSWDFIKYDTSYDPSNISIKLYIDSFKKEYFEETEEGRSELLKAIKFLNDIGINSEWKGGVELEIGHLDNWWLKDAKTGIYYIGNQDAEQLIEFATNLQNFYKGLSVEQIKAKRELEIKKEEIEKAREDNKWIVKYISTDDNDVASVWVIAENREDAIEQAKEDNWDIGEIISVSR